MVRIIAEQVKLCVIASRIAIDFSKNFPNYKEMKS